MPNLFSQQDNINKNKKLGINQRKRQNQNKCLISEQEANVAAWQVFHTYVGFKDRKLFQYFCYIRHLKNVFGPPLF